MKLYSPSNNHKLDMLLFAAKVYGKSIEHVEVPFSHKNKHFQDHHAPFMLPALEIDEQHFVFGTSTILSVLAHTPECPLERAEIQGWLELSGKEVENSVGVLLVKKQELGQVHEEQRNKAIKCLSGVLKQIDERLKIKTFLVGDRMTSADISLYFGLTAVQQQLGEESKKLVNFTRWSKHMSSLWKNM